MKREDIENAAKKEAENLACLVYYGGSAISQEDVENACVNVAEWRINSVWHDVKEMPENNRMILIIMKHDIPTVLGPDNTFFREEIKDRHIQRWAYIKDLIPNTEK